MRRWLPLAACFLLLLAGCSSQPPLLDTPERPETFTNQTMIDYATQSEGVAIHNRIVDDGDVEGDVNVSCHGRPLYRTGERAVAAVACWPEPYVRDDGHAETGPQYSIHVFDNGTISVVRPSGARRVVHNESARGSLWIVNTAMNNRSVTVRMLSRNGSNQTILEGEGVNGTSGLTLVGVRDHDANWLRIEVGNRRLCLAEWEDHFRSRMVVLIAPDGTLRATALEYPLSEER